MAELGFDEEDMRKLRSVKEVPRFSTIRTISALILREMSATYGRSPGGYVWAVAEPVLGIGLLVAFFSVGFRQPPLGSNFAMFYASGLLPLMMFTTTSIKVAQAINYSRQLLNYPRVTFVDAILARFILNVLTQSVIAFVLIGVILMVFETRTIFDLPLILNGFASAAVLGLGMGTLLCTLISQHPIWNSVWSVITRPLFLISGVIFLHEDVPEPYRSWLDWNPMVHSVAETRKGFYYSYRAEYIDMSYVYGLALICGVAGILFLRRYYRDMMEK
ncbi:ABC transporter permease [Paracoccus aerodenitrificans]|uniref:ABC transporter permease n=1 Tax=Paracoccus aerodenitrificans TaxID=3017781 RepID=UPI0022F10BD7|nr:ABC transporter permease [Paracoccus aerodenitrificans]WBU63890.1 ABC transporter permease [Paracoccus aerodenitrificans]